MKAGYEEEYADGASAAPWPQLDGVRPKTSPALDDDRRSEDGEGRGGAKSQHKYRRRYRCRKYRDIYRLMSTLELNLILLSMCLAFVCMSMSVFDVILLCCVCDLIRIIRFNLHVSGIFSFVSLSHD